MHDTKTEAQLAEWMSSLADVNWEEIRSLHTLTSALLSKIAAHKAILIGRMYEILEDPALFDRCESDGFFDRVILFERKPYYSLRLHSLTPIAYDRPHNHRTTFAALQLAGTYQHSIYPSIPAELMAQGEEIPKSFIQNFKPLQVTQQKEGDTYCIHHDTFHSTIPEKGHLSLVIKGPAMKDRLLFIDERNETVEWMYGGQWESPEQLAEKKMKPATLLSLIDRIKNL